MPMSATLDGYIPPLLVIAVALLLMTIRWRYCQNQQGRAVVWANVVSMMVIVSFAGLLELAMGRTPTYKYGAVRLWSGDIHSNQNSQQIADPYTLTHCIHGVAFYGFTQAAFGSWAVGLRAIVAVTMEAAWEVLENTDMVINRYRATTISLDYYGDSVINSVGDMLASALGFVLAWRFPRRVTIIGIVLVEVFLVLWIRDNLTLNIIMLLYPMPAIATWQRGM